MTHPRKPSKVKWIGLLLVVLILLLIPAALVLAANGFHLVARPASGGESASGGEYSLHSAIGQPEKGKLTGEAYRLNGGVVGEMLDGGSGGDGLTIYLPLISRNYRLIKEVEPNNLFSEANLITLVPVDIFGSHDGAANTGDVFMLDDDLIIAGNVVIAAIATNDPAGLQLVAYDANGDEVARDYDDSHTISFIAANGDAHYIYVFTDPAADNSAAYKLTITISQ